MKRSPNGRLTPAELTCFQLLSDAGWTVYRSGWPDFLCIDETNNLAMGIEVKNGKDLVSEVQDQMHRALSDIGIPVYVVNHPRLLSQIVRDRAERWRFRYDFLVRDGCREEEEEWIG